MFTRLSLLAGMTWTVACATTPGSLQLLPEPTFVAPAPAEAAPAPAPIETAGELASVWRPADLAAPTGPRDVVYTEPGELPQLLHAGVAFPLRRTDVLAELRGDAAEVVVKQRFVNDGEAALEAIYTFPLPENAAVTDMRMTIGDRVIASEIRERSAARQVYQEARDAGNTAALLEQERPNIFTQSVANIPRGAAIEVEIRYAQTLSYDAGEYEFVFPTVVGPRYIPGGGRVQDAARISPPVLGHGLRSGHDIGIEVLAEAGSPIHQWLAPGHHVEQIADPQRLHLKLARRDEIANRDFVLRYRSAASQPVARLFLGPAGAHGGHFMLVVEPPQLDVDALVGARELIFVVDVSGSMGGAPLTLAKAAVRQALAGVRPVDTFDVIVFSGRSARLFAEPRPANAANLRSAVDFIDGLHAGGGTEMASAVEAALASPVAPGRHRYVAFFTDGYTGEEDAIASGARALVERQGRLDRRARVFGVGVGSSPNSHLIAALARAGDGLPLYIHAPADVARAVRSFQGKIDAPVLTDVAVDWAGLRVADVAPQQAPDLFASRPLVLHGRYSDAAPRPLRLLATVAGQRISFPIAVTTLEGRDDRLGPLWARARVDELDLVRLTADSQLASTRAVDQIRELGLRHRLVTAYTSLVAVDTSQRQQGPQLTVVQPVEAPSGTTPAFGSLNYVPVGGTARDFTAVLDLSPSASRDTAGVRLAGTSGAESSYAVDGASIVVNAAPVRELHFETSIERPPTLPRTGTQTVVAHASPRLRSLRALHGAPDLRAAREQATLALPALGKCFVAADPASYRVRRKLSVTVQLGDDGKILGLALHGPGSGDLQLGRCLKRELGELARAARSPNARLELVLVVWMQY